MGKISYDSRIALTFRIMYEMFDFWETFELYLTKQNFIRVLPRAVDVAAIPWIVSMGKPTILVLLLKAGMLVRQAAVFTEKRGLNFLGKRLKNVTSPWDTRKVWESFSCKVSWFICWMIVERSLLPVGSFIGPSELERRKKKIPKVVGRL